MPIRRHPRASEVQQASIALSLTVEQWRKDFTLTQVEALLCLNREVAQVAASMLQVERHPNNPTKPSGEA